MLVKGKPNDRSTINSNRNLFALWKVSRLIRITNSDTSKANSIADFNI